MPRCNLLILYLLLLPYAALSQPTKADSIKARLPDADGLLQIEMLLDLAELSQRSEPREAIDYTDSALALLKKRPDPVLEIEARYRRGWAHIYNREYDEALSQASLVDSAAHAASRNDGIAKACLLKARVSREQREYQESIHQLDKAIQLAEQGPDKFLKLQLLNETGSVYRRLGENRKALGYHQQALDLSTELDDKLSISTTLGYLGIIHDILGNYDEALKYQQQTLAIRKELKDRRGVAAALTNIGIMHQKIESFDEAMRFYHEALAIWDNLDREPEIASVYNNMGGVQDMMGHYEEALQSYEKALAIWRKYGKIHSTSTALRNIGSVYMAMGNNEGALDMHMQALEIRQSYGDQNGSASSLLDIAEIYQVLGQNNLTLETAAQGLELAVETESWPLVMDAREIMASIYEANGDYANALIHFKAFKAATDTIFNIERQSVIADLQQQYHATEQQQQIELLQQQGEIRSLWLGILIGGLVFIGSVLALLYNRYQLKQKAHEAEQELYDREIEQEKLRTEKAQAQAKYLQADNRRKTGELEAARELQLSLLPSKIPEHPELLISAYMKTATEVGGDYFDFDLAGDGTLTIAIGDATGHGARAGTMVTAVKSLFNLLASQQELTEILRLGSKAIKKMNMAKLYMALAVVRLNDNKLELAGAGMPPALIYRASEKVVEQVPLKGMPLGSVEDYPYRKTAIILRKDDVVLLSSDGFAELSNGEGRMLSYELVPEMLRAVGERSPTEIIQSFRETASSWLGEDGMPQDDVTFIVLKSKVDFHEMAGVSRVDLHQ